MKKKMWALYASSIALVTGCFDLTPEEKAQMARESDLVENVNEEILEPTKIEAKYDEFIPDNYFVNFSECKRAIINLKRDVETIEQPSREKDSLLMTQYLNEMIMLHKKGIETSDDNANVFNSGVYKKFKQMKYIALDYDSVVPYIDQHDKTPRVSFGQKLKN